jgi:hypothetical protein
VKLRGAIGKIASKVAGAFWRRSEAPITLSELEFLKLTANHAEYSNKLRKLGLAQASDKIRRDAYAIASCWYRLALDHLEDAEHALRGPKIRSVYSRSYYAAYNASKALRYIHHGAVNLTGDDHKKAVDLPDDFPRSADFSAQITTLYEHRLLADYDNWRDTGTRFTLDPRVSIELAREFVEAVREFAYEKYKCKL